MNKDTKVIRLDICEQLNQTESESEAFPETEIVFAARAPPMLDVPQSAAVLSHFLANDNQRSF